VTADRDEALRRAEWLLRQEQLEAAVAECLSLAAVRPDDLILLNALGDLLVRAGAPAHALPLFTRVADASMAEGFHARAAGFYKKVLRFAPDDEGVLLKLADACASQGKRADARTCLQSVAAARHRRVDRQGLVEVLGRLDDLDPADVTTRTAAVRALAGIDPAGAQHRLRRIAVWLDSQGRDEEALSVWAEVLKASPADATAAVRVGRSALAGGDPGRARDALSGAALDAPEDFALLVEALMQSGEIDRAAASLSGRLHERPEQAAALDQLAARLASAGPPAHALADDGEPGPASGAGDGHAMEAEIVDIEGVEPLAIDAAPVALFVEPVEEGPAARDTVEVEVDLTDLIEAGAAERGAVLTSGPTARPAPEPAAAAPRDKPASAGLADALGQLRDQVLPEGADLIALGRTYGAAGLADQAVEAFTAAAADPSCAYDAALALVEHYETRRSEDAAMQWMECAVRSAPSAAKRGAVLYRLGLLLERRGEVARAQSVLEELHTLAPGFRDVEARLARMGSRQSGGGSSGR
jgi:tetratricopeptide (TPR) repeat protein